MSKTIGLIGAGLMGHGIGSNLLKHGHSLVVLEHPGNQPLDGLRKVGARTANQANALAAQVEVVILCVTGSAQVEAVMLADDGVLKGLRAGGLIIDCSTAVPGSTEMLAQKTQAQGGLFIDAPMTRSVKEAAEGRLNLLVGGDATVLDLAKPILRCFAENITHMGPVGSGHRMKLLHNYVALGMASLLAEASACARRAEIDPVVFVDVLSKGGGAGTALERLKPFILKDDPTGLRFTIANGLKDMTYYNAMAEQSCVDRTIAEAVRHSFDEAVQAGFGDELVPEMVRLIAER
jgi:3-hydroxyisobutyrate dehydrogenase-like beta-hydroxyacid dehydrogenase